MKKDKRIFLTVEQIETLEKIHELMSCDIYRLVDEHPDYNESKMIGHLEEIIEQTEETKLNLEQIEYMDNCAECNNDKCINVTAMFCPIENEVVKFVSMDCTICGWNQIG